MDEPDPKSRDLLGSRGLLLLAAVATVVAWQFEVGRFVLYPFTLLATYAHEMGHGMAALLVGGQFESLEIYPNASGLARWRGDVGRLGRAFVALGGLIGPSLIGATILALSRHARRAPWLLGIIAAVMLVSVVLYVRTGFGIIFVMLVAAGLLATAIYARGSIALFLVQLIGVQLCLSVFHDLGYMFSPGALVDGTHRLSDSGIIAEALWLPYWVWGAMAALTSFLAVGLGLRLALRTPKERSARAEPAG